MVINARISRSANIIGSNNTSKGDKEPRTVKTLNTQWGALGRLNKISPGEISTRNRKEKSDPSVASRFKTSSDHEKMERDSTVENKMRKNLFGRHGVIQCFNKMVPLQEIQSTKLNCNVKGSRKSSINTEIRKVTSKKDLWPVRPSGGIPSRSISYNTNLKTPLLNATKTDGRRPPLRMPARIPKANKKLKYVITVVGNEIKLVDPKTKAYRMTSAFKPYFASPPTFRKISTLSRQNAKRVYKTKRRNKAKNVKPCRLESIEGTNMDELLSDVGTDGMMIELNGKDLPQVVEIQDRDGLRKTYKFSDRRTKAEVPAKSVQVCTGEEILLERLDPISNILSTELLDSVKRCQSIIDFVTAPIENPNPPFMMKQIFYDTTMMEELNFPPLTTAELSSTAIPELKLVPSLPRQTKKSLSFPDLAIIVPKHASRSVCFPARRKKKKPKIETILATRPRGFQHAKWLEKTVGADSALKSKLLQDVIISQVRKCLKRQAELRQKLQSNSDVTGNNDPSSKSHQKRIPETPNTTFQS